MKTIKTIFIIVLNLCLNRYWNFQNAIKPLETEIKSLKEMLQNFEHSKQFNDEMLTDVQVAELLKIGKSTVWHKIKNDPSFPKPTKIGNATRWSKKRLFSI